VKSLAATAALVLVPLVWTPAVAEAAGATCQGQAATIEGSNGTVNGTASDDVIVVTGTVSRVYAGDGADLVCLVDTTKLGGRRVVQVDSGAGDDVVDASGAGAGTSIGLGPGADTLTGSPFDDYVTVGVHSDTMTAGDPGPYVVTSGAGRDTVTLLGKGATVDARLGRGPDVIAIRASFAGPDSVFDLGRGKDSAAFEVYWDEPGAGATSLFADLTQDSVTWRGVTSTLLNTENISGYAERVKILGDGEPNRFYGHGCNVDLRGGGGEDRLTLSSFSAMDIAPVLAECEPTTRLRARGNRGDDFMSGGKRHDVFIGGLGRDKAHGGPAGHDRCDAEIVAGKGCQRP
jgi:hypothetical protein